MPVSALTRSRLGLDDLDDIVEVLTASDLSVVGFPDFTRDDIVADLTQDGLEAYGCRDGTGRLVAYAWVARTGDSNKVELDLYVHPDHDPDLGHEVLALLEQRARALVAEPGHGEPWLDIGVYRQDHRSQEWVRRAGFESRTTFTRMRIDLGTEDARAATPGDPSVVVRRVQDEADLRAAHAIEEQSFLEHYGHVPRTYESWLERLTAQGPDASQVWLADLDGRPVGVMVTNRQFEESDDAAYVRTLGVLPAGRGRGVAKAMLRDAFRRAWAAGRVAVLLHVDVANVTGALRLYESVGMRPVLVIDAWAKGESSG
jgi:ribosomal protein S18 acetylase RimI-like enzyme